MQFNNEACLVCGGQTVCDIWGYGSDTGLHGPVRLIRISWNQPGPQLTHGPPCDSSRVFAFIVRDFKALEVKDAGTNTYPRDSAVGGFLDCRLMLEAKQMIYSIEVVLRISVWNLETASLPVFEGMKRGNIKKILSLQMKSGWMTHNMDLQATFLKRRGNISAFSGPYE